MTADEFDRRLTELIREAKEKGVDVEGGWDVETGSNSGYSVEIFPVVTE
ncbi:hypothetical protein ACFO0N_03555 [Halobium salinum]|uniref:Uncharacterized protein n=1 Tax=Halobium salinum TaxID=1364940 RepID=A0ABD5P804_9EURY|nr:hypothetical protein [Halobium salinum]